MKKKFSKKQIAFVLVAICLVGLIGIGVSYSYYLANISTSNEQSKNSNISSATITKVVMDMQGKVTSDGAYPGHVTVKEVIVRGIGEENSIPANASIQITPDLGDFSSDVTWKLYKSEEAITCSSTLHKEGNIYEESTCNIPSSATLESEGSSGTKYKNIVVKPNTETKYYLVVEYLNKTDIDQSGQMGKYFSIDIGIGEKQATPLEKIIASVDTTGKCPTINDDGTVKVTDAEETDGYICTAPDVYGTSYYYRGNVSNNYVKFADKYWRIVRINGDDSLRVIYDGTEAHANGEASTDRQIGTSEFNKYWKKDNVQETTNSYVYFDNAGVGYMYGNRDGVVEETRSYNGQSMPGYVYISKEYVYDKINDKFSLKDPIKIYYDDDWQKYIGYYFFLSGGLEQSKSYYEHEIYKHYLTEGHFLFVRYGTTTKEVSQTNTNDSTIKTYLDNWYKNNFLNTEFEKYLVDNIFCNNRLTDWGGYGAEDTYYSFKTETSRLKCPQKNDTFTVNDATNGNSALTYPIGLITYDEAVLAGASSSNSKHYLYSGQNYWTMTPEDFDSHAGSKNYHLGNGYNNEVYSLYGVRPVLNISQEILNKGDGSMNNPYRIE